MGAQVDRASGAIAMWPLWHWLTRTRASCGRCWPTTASTAPTTRPRNRIQRPEAELDVPKYIDPLEVGELEFNLVQARRFAHGTLPWAFHDRYGRVSASDTLQSLAAIPSSRMERRGTAIWQFLK